MRNRDTSQAGIARRPASPRREQQHQRAQRRARREHEEVHVVRNAGRAPQDVVEPQRDDVPGTERDRQRQHAPGAEPSTMTSATKRRRRNPIARRIAISPRRSPKDSVTIVPTRSTQTTMLTLPSTSEKRLKYASCPCTVVEHLAHRVGLDRRGSGRESRPPRRRWSRSGRAGRSRASTVRRARVRRARACASRVRSARLRCVRRSKRKSAMPPTT